MLLTVLPIDVQIEIAGHNSVTSDRPMDDLRSIWVTYSSMHRICGDLTIGQCLALDQVRHGRTRVDPVNYYALLASLTQVDNSEACFLTGIQIVFMEKRSPSQASTISPAQPMAGKIWWPI